MNTDYFSKIGSTHQTNQDYVSVGSDYIILNDGCSSAEESGIGAMLLNRITRQFIKNKTEYGMMDYHTIVKIADEYAKFLGFPKECLYATLLSCYANIEHNKFHISIFGDGAYAVRHRNGTWDIFVREFDKNAPYYPKYLTDDYSRDAYCDAGLGNNKMTKYILANNRIALASILSMNISGVESTSYPFEEYDMVVLFSDGILSLLPESYEIFKEFLSFKNFTGKFVQRRAIAGLKSFADLGIVNTDDFSMAAIYHGELND